MIQKNNILSARFVAVLCLICALGHHCSDSGNPPENDAIFAEQDRRQVIKDSVDGYERFSRESGLQIIKNEQIIAEIRVRIITGETALKTRFQKRLNALENRNNVLASQFRQYPEMEPEKQNTFKINWVRDMKSLSKALNDIMNELQK